MKIKTIIRQAFLSCLLLILYSCSDNNIYFDINNVSVKTCNRRIIASLYINSKDHKDYYHFTIMSKKVGSNTFSLSKLSQEYTLKNEFREISSDRFKLKPEMEYEITNSTFGDATPSKLLIRTDKNRKVIYSNVTSCK